MYGVLEKQFRRYFAEASRRRGVTGTILIQLLEQRLDNVAYRLGFSNTRSGARQLVGHGHILVNGRRCDIPSYSCKPGDEITVRDIVGQVHKIKTSDIKERKELEMSMMPPGLANALSVEDFASLLTFLQSKK